MSTFRIGQRVVCIKGGWQDARTKEKTHGPVKDQVYTIMEIGYDLKYGVMLVFPEWPLDQYYAGSFRPVIDLLDEQLDDIENTSIEELEEELCQTL